MKRHLRSTLLAMCLSSACGNSPPPESPSPAIDARPEVHSAQHARAKIRYKCATGAAEAKDVHLLRTMTVVAAEPVYVRTPSPGGKGDDRVAGSKIVFRRP